MRQRAKDVVGDALIAALARHLGTRPAHADAVDGQGGTRAGFILFSLRS